MTKYRCIIHLSTGNYIPYSGASLESALDHMQQNMLADTILVERLGAYGWEVISGVYRKGFMV